MAFTMPVAVRYLEVDAQGVVFNAWYLAWFDEAMAAFLAHGGLPYASMVAAGFDVQLVRSEIDWKAGIGFGDQVEIAVSTARIGHTSFALDFEVRRGRRRRGDLHGPHRLRGDRHRRHRQAEGPRPHRRRPRRPTAGRGRT